MLTRPAPSLWRTLAIAGAGLALPLLWPGVLPNLLATLPAHGTHSLPAGLNVLSLGSDLLIGASYTVIASILALIVYQNRRALPFDWVVLAFGLFIVACGLTHVMHVLVRVTPLYWLDGYIRALTAVVSVATAAALPPLIPRVSQLLGAEAKLEEQRRQLEASNAALQESARRNEVLAALGDALQGVQTGEDAQRIALSRLGPALEATAMLVLTLRGQDVHVSVTWGTLPESVAATRERAGLRVPETTVLREVVTTGRAIYRGGAPTATEGQTGSGAYGLEPIVAPGGRVTGAVAVWRPAGQEWTPGQQDLMRRAAATISLALERAAAVAQLAEQRDALAAANARLERSNTDLDRFASIASHDLQAPIRAVTSFSELLRARYGTQLDPKGQAYLEQIVGNGHHMKRLVDDLLMYSRATTTAPTFAAVDMGGVLATVLARLQPQLQEAGARVDAGTLPVVWGDAQQLDRLLQNLLGNAVKYRRDVPLNIGVQARCVDERWQFDVSDNGQGIEPQYFKRIFELFQRLHGREAEGTGLGLAICQRIAEQHGGQIWLSSVPGEGSTFSFTLPALPGGRELAG